MFWGVFASSRKGPGFIWEKAYGGINATNYIKHILPLITDFHHQQPFIFQQDNTPAHKARRTKDKIQKLGIELLPWPPYSPDLSPIENVWAWMKDWMALNCDDIQALDLVELRSLIERAWEAVPKD